MKYLILFSAFFLLTVNGVAQSILFHEDFEAPSYDTTGWSYDSLNCYSTPIIGHRWFRDDNLFSEGNSGIHRQTVSGATVYLNTITFSTLGYDTIYLKFDQICKVDFLDIATIEVSSNRGLTWTQLTGLQYIGAGGYAQNGNRFAANSYGNLWQPSNSIAVPLNTWWKSETFNCSVLLANTPDAMVRFKLADGGTVGANNNYGWCIDNLSILGNGMNPFSGNITYDNSLAIPLSFSEVTLVYSNLIFSTTNTGPTGFYQFPACAPGFNLLYVSTTKPWGGVNASDAQSVLLHFIGTQPLSGLKLLAADVNGDHIVNSSDALMIMKRFVGLINSFPTGDWVFEPAGFNIPLPSPIIINIKGLCYGDVNGSYIPTFP